MKTRSIDHPSSVFAAGSLGPAVRTGLGQEAIATAAIADHLHYQQGVSSHTRPATTGTWRSRWPFATACSIGTLEDDRRRAGLAGRLANQ